MITRNDVTLAQWDALENLFQRQLSGDSGGIPWDQFINGVYIDTFFDCVMVSLWGMQIGIEKDGYTHS